MPRSSAASSARGRWKRRQHRTEPAAPQRELEAPHRRVDRRPYACVRAPLRVVLDARDDEHRHLLQPVRQPQRALADAGHPFRAGAGPVHVRPESGAVHVRECGTLVGVGHDDPVPALAVRTGGRLDREAQAFFDDLGRDRTVEVEALAYGTRRGQQMVDGVELGRFGGHESCGRRSTRRVRIPSSKVQVASATMA